MKKQVFLDLKVSDIVQVCENQVNGCESCPYFIHPGCIFTCGPYNWMSLFKWRLEKKNGSD